MSEVADKLVQNTFVYANVPCVVDADALNLVAKDMTIMQNRKQM